MEYLVMASSFADRTSSSLLGRLQQESVDQEAWGEFVRRYGRQIYHWCRKRHLQEADAQDVTQTVLVRLAQRMRSFRYDPAQSFRAYLKTLTHYAWCDFLESRQRPGAGSGDSQVLELLLTVEARDDLVQYLNREFDQELLDEAMERVRRRVEVRTWDVFRLVALEGRSGAEVAQQLDMRIAAVYVVKGRVQKMIREEVARLECPDVEGRAGSP
jgi:RNA polymerase sigma-70 factor (ECF subfamily)